MLSSFNIQRLIKAKEPFSLIGRTAISLQDAPAEPLSHWWAHGVPGSDECRPSIFPSEAHI